MAKLGINTGSAPNDGTGDSILQGAIKINSNFNEIYNAIGNGTTITNSIGFARTAGISTLSGYASTAGIATFAVTAGISSYSVISGLSSLSSYATNAGIATVALFAGNFSSIPDITVGVVTATSYNGSGVNLTGVITSILAGSNVSVARTGGTVTINSTAQSAVSTQWTTVSSGIVTSSRVGINTNAPISALHLNNGTLSITGLSGGIQMNDGRRINLGSDVDSSIYYDSVDLRIDTSSSVRIGDGNNNIFVAVSGEGASLYYNGSRKLQTLSDGLDVTGKINLSGNINASGIVTASSFVGDGSRLTNISSQLVRTGAGIHTLSNVGIGTTNPTSALTVKGNTSIETLNVSGVSTFSGKIKGPVLFSKDGSATAAQNVEINNDGSAAFLNVGGSSSFYFDSPNTNIRNTFTGGRIRMDSPSGIDFEQYGLGGAYRARFEDTNVSLYSSNSLKFQTIGAGVTVTGTTFTNQLSVSGNVSVGGTINLDGGLKLTTNNPTIVGTSGTVGEIKRIGGAPFFYDGSAWREFVLSSGTPVSVPADTEWDNVVFRATFDTDFTDAKFGVSPSFIGAGATIVGAAVTIGTGAFRNDAQPGAGVRYPYRTEYNFAGSWTIEFWIYIDSFNNSALTLLGSKSDTNADANWALTLNGDAYANRRIFWSNENNAGGVNQVVYSNSGAGFDSIFIDKWNHIALVRQASNGSIHFYLNGVESGDTYLNQVIDNDILYGVGSPFLFLGGGTQGYYTINGTGLNNGSTIDAIYDDLRISAGVGTAGQRYTSVGITTYATFTPPTTALPTTGTLSSRIQPPGDKYGEIGLGTSPTWRGTSGVTVTQQSSGNYRVSFASSYTNANDYFVLTQGMDQGFASYVGVGRSTTHVDFSINRESDNSAVNTGSLSVQIKNHV